MLLHYAVSHLSHYCWRLLSLTWSLHVLWGPAPATSPRSKTGCATPLQWCLQDQDKSPPQLCWHLGWLCSASARSSSSSPMSDGEDGPVSRAGHSRCRSGLGSRQHCCRVLCSSQAPSQPRHPDIAVTFIIRRCMQTENTIDELIYFRLLLMTFHDFHNSASLHHSWVMRSSVTQGNKWSFPSAYCISPFITFLLPTFKVLSPSILFYSGITFRCRDVYESGQNGSVQLGFTGGRAMLTHRYKGHFFSKPSDHVRALQPNYASAQARVFALNKAQCFLLTTSLTHLRNKVCHRNAKKYHTNHWCKGLEKMFEG